MAGPVVNGLAVTHLRLQLLDAIADPADAVYHEAGEWWWRSTGQCVNSAVSAMEDAGWVRRVPGLYRGREDAALTDVGRQVLDGAR
jgi:hypothetical protein